MAKLEGVKIIDAKNGDITKIKYEGNTYVNVGDDKDNFKVGDIALNKEDALDADADNFYEVIENGLFGFTTIYDDADESHSDILYHADIFRNIDAGFREVDRFPEEGDYIRFTDEDLPDWIRADKHYEVIRIDSWGDPHIIDEDGDSYDLSGDRYDVFEKVEDGPERDETTPKRKPKPGDKIRITNPVMAAGEYDKDDILTVEEYVPAEGTRMEHVIAEDTGIAILMKEFEVIEDDEETPPFEIGDKVKLVIKDGESPRYNWGAVDNGEIGEVAYVRSDGVIKVDFPSQEDWSAMPNELEIIEEVDIPFVVGDYVVPLPSADVYGITNTDMYLGKVVELGSGENIRIEIIAHDNEYLVDSTAYTVRARHFRKATEEEIEAAMTEELSVGDYVKVVGITHFADIDEGTIVKIGADKDDEGDYIIELLDGTDFDYAKPESLEKVELSDRELTYVKAGREINHNKVGDIVRVTGGYSGIREGDIGVVTNEQFDGVPKVRVGDCEYFVEVELVAPVETRVDMDA